MKNLTVLSGAGISAESGVKTFRDHGGLWETRDISEIATPEAWQNNRKELLDFYNQRRRQLHEVNPNAAHKALVDLQPFFNVNIITQNVDDLHERAGSDKITHLHGEMFKVRSTVDPDLLYRWTEDLHLGDRCEKGSQLRPHVVWFGEPVPMMETAIKLVEKSSIILIIGTSLQVYPAAGLMHYAPEDCTLYYIDPDPGVKSRGNFHVIAEKAGTAVPKLVKKLIH